MPLSWSANIVENKTHKRIIVVFLKLDLISSKYVFLTFPFLLITKKKWQTVSLSYKNTIKYTEIYTSNETKYKKGEYFCEAIYILCAHTVLMGYRVESIRRSLNTSSLN